jgi:hypothetical protein
LIKLTATNIAGIDLAQSPDKPKLSDGDQVALSHIKAVRRIEEDTYFQIPNSVMRDRLDG